MYRRFDCAARGAGNGECTSARGCQLSGTLHFRIIYKLFILQKVWLNFVDAARGALLHDLFLYDWHIKGSHKGLHGFTHPKTALQNASKICDLTEKEKDIIVKHMWPLTIRLPKYRESFVVSGADKLCALAEMLHIYHILKVGLRLNVVPAAAAL